MHAVNQRVSYRWLGIICHALRIYDTYLGIVARQCKRSCLVFTSMAHGDNTFDYFIDFDYRYDHHHQHQEIEHRTCFHSGGLEVKGKGTTHNFATGKERHIRTVVFTVLILFILHTYALNLQYAIQQGIKFQVGAPTLPAPNNQKHQTKQ